MKVLTEGDRHPSHRLASQVELYSILSVNGFLALLWGITRSSVKMIKTDTLI
jgi:hypothetical protein